MLNYTFGLFQLLKKHTLQVNSQYTLSLLCYITFYLAHTCKCITRVLKAERLVGLLPGEKIYFYVFVQYIQKTYNECMNTYIMAADHT